MTEATEEQSTVDTDTENRPESDADATESSAPTESSPPEPESFPREYVENLRKENADARVRAKAADDLAARLHTELVRATNRLADPSDLPFDENHLEDVSIMDAALDDLLSRKPHLASRRPSGDIGQGATSEATGVDLAGILRSRAG